MAQLSIHEPTSLTRQQFIAALTDFGPDRGRFWHNSQHSYLIIHAKNETSADVTEGSGIFGGVWERLRYGWSDPNHIMLRTTDSNVWSDRSSWQYRFDTDQTGKTVITYTIKRFPLNLKARLIMLFVVLFGKRLIRKDFRRTLRAIEHTVDT